MPPSTDRDAGGLFQKLSALSSTIISDALGRSGGMVHAIRPMYPGARCCGPAYTVKNAAKDNLMSHYALKHSRPGDVLVLDGSCGRHGSGWGELMSLAAKLKGLGGIVLDGTIRDIDQLPEIGFPVFARGVQAEGTVKSTPGEVERPVCCGGLTVLPGDVLIGDENGVVVVPRDRAETVLEAALSLQAKEEGIRSRLLEGETLYDILGLGSVFAAKPR